MYHRHLWDVRHKYIKNLIHPGTIAQSDAPPPGMQAVTGSILTSSNIFFVEIGHEVLSTAILSLPLIQAGQLSVTGEGVCTKYWLTA